MGRWGGRTATPIVPPLAMDKSSDYEHEIVIRYKGDFNWRKFIQSLDAMAVGASRSVTVDYEDNPFRGTWDGDGADRIVSAEIDGTDILNDGAKDFGIGELSSTDMEKFRRMNPKQQQELIRLLERVKRATGPAKAEAQMKLKQFEASL